MSRWRRPLEFGVLRFGIVGGLATAIHASCYLLLTQYANENALLANVASFTVAFAVSYAGHSGWTFAGHGVGHRRSLTRFLCLSLSGLGANLAFTWLIVDRLHCPSQTALVGIVFVVPLLSFLGNRYWVFRKADMRPAAFSRRSDA